MTRTLIADLYRAGTERYVYDPSGQRVWKQTPSGVMLYFYGVDGSLLRTYCDGSDSDYNVYFAGKQIWAETAWGSPTLWAGPVALDRLGSTVRHFPYGDEPTTAAQDRVKFATYYRDSASTLDYARNRYYARSIGRFTSPDPYKASGGPADSQSWNRYAYVQNNPVNFDDPSGLIRQRPEDPPVGYCQLNPLDMFCRPGSMGIKGGPGIADTPDGIYVTVAEGVLPNGRKRTPECDSLLPVSPTGDFSGSLTDSVIASIHKVSGGEATLAALVTVTWWAESRFAMSPVNNGQAYGPLQITPGSWDAWFGDAGVTADAVFGPEAATARGSKFAGSSTANLSFGTYVLKTLMGKYDAADAAGYFRAGEGSWVNTPEGRAAFEGRKGHYTNWTNGTNGRLTEFFEKCVNW